MAIDTYSTGTVAIAANATTVAGTGSNWSGQNAMSGDLLVVAGNTVIVQDVTDALTLAIDAWPYAAVTSGTAYKLYKVSPLRFAGGQAMAAVDQLVADLNTDGFYVFVGPDLSVPDPSYGNDNQYAFQATTGKLWQKTGGTWNFIGIQKGWSAPVAWDSATTWEPFNTVTDAGSSYFCILENTNQRPPNATYWTPIAEKGEQGEQGDTGTAATITVGTVTTGTAGSAATVTNSGTDAAAVFDLSIPKGQDGTGIGDVVGPSSATDGGLIVFDGTTGKLVKALDDAAAARTELGSTMVGGALFTAIDADAARAELGSTTVGDALFVATDAAAARTAIGAAIAPTVLTNSLSSDVTVSTSTFTDGPSVAQGSSGTWFVSGTVTFTGTASSIIFAKLWDGTTTIASTGYNQQPSASRQTLSLSGVITNPAGNLRISAIEQNGQTTSFKFSATSIGKDCTITALRIA